MKQCSRNLHKNIYRVLEASIPLAIGEATGRAAAWGADKSSGGLAWSTYKATVRRDGIHNGSVGLRDFNQDLFEPISRNLAAGWDRAFQRRIPVHLDEFGKTTQGQLKEFHEAVQADVRGRRTNVSGLATLSSQVLVHMRTLEHLSAVFRTTVTDLQREANRKFTPSICQAMKYAYTICTEERGMGSYNRMKAAMTEHVEKVRNTMFHSAAKTVKTQLEAMCKTLERQMNEEMENMFGTIFREYMQVLGEWPFIDRYLVLPPLCTSTVLLTLTSQLARGSTGMIYDSLRTLPCEQMSTTFYIAATLCSPLHWAILPLNNRRSQSNRKAMLTMSEISNLRTSIRTPRT